MCPMTEMTRPLSAISIPFTSPEIGPRFRHHLMGTKLQLKDMNLWHCVVYFYCNLSSNWVGGRLGTYWWGTMEFDGETNRDLVFFARNEKTLEIWLFVFRGVCVNVIPGDHRSWKRVARICILFNVIEPKSFVAVVGHEKVNFDRRLLLLLQVPHKQVSRFMGPTKKNVSPKCLF